MNLSHQLEAEVKGLEAIEDFDRVDEHMPHPLLEQNLQTQSLDHPHKEPTDP